MEIKYILLFIFFTSFIKCDLIIIGPSDLASRYYNQPIEIVFGKMSDISNFYVHGEIVFENTTSHHVACLDLLALALFPKKQEMLKMLELQCYY